MGKNVLEYKGPVFAQVTRGIGAIRSLAATWQSMTGDRSKGQEQSIIEIREIALKEIEENAQSLGANAIIGLDIDIEIITQNNITILLCKAYATAVVLD